MFPHNVTVYNHYVDSGKDKWKRTLLKGVLWDEEEGTIRRKIGAESADGLRLIIPFVVESDSRYLSPKEFEKQRRKTGFWTLRDGDSVVKGDVRFEINRSSKELEKYDSVFLISAVDTKDFGGGMAHWEVTGK